ncbi:MAG: Gmad2 immunoglobulin-like domain-containing protein [Patescibacteria group bacterium]
MKKIISIIIAILILVATGAGVFWQMNKKNEPAGKEDLIRVDSPKPNQTVQNPLIITGEARGHWFFEASFPVVLVDWDGLIIGQGIAQAKSDWMTADFVPFEATLTFTADKNAYSNRGTLILRKDNPSGLPEHDDAFEIPVLIKIK